MWNADCGIICEKHTLLYIIYRVLADFDWLFSQIENRFGTHVHQQIDDAEIGDEPMFMSKNLIIPVLFQVVLSAFRLYVSASHSNGFGVQLDEAGYDIYELEIEFGQRLLISIIDSLNVVLIILEERAVEIGRLQSVPMFASPVVVVAQQDFVLPIMPFRWFPYRNSEGQRTIRRIDCASVSPAPFPVWQVIIERRHSVAYPFSPPADRRKVFAVQVLIHNAKLRKNGETATKICSFCK